MRPSLTAVTLLLTAPASSLSIAGAQVSVQGGLQLGRAEHRVFDQGVLIPSWGTLYGGALTVRIGDRWEIRGQALGGQLAVASTPSLEDNQLAEAELLGGLTLRPWLTVQTGFNVRNYSNSLARQHWTTWLLGAETEVPLGFERVTAIMRGYWMPLVSVSDLPSPNVALVAGVGLAWRGQRLGVSGVYTLERYDFPPSNGTRRLEEVSTIRLRVIMWWPRSR